MHNITKLICLISLSCFLGCAGTKNTSMNKSAAFNPVIAHRGAFKKNGFPENSIAALREAIRLGCAGSEFDVRMTADDSLVINHDEHYHDRDIEKTPYNQLAAYPLSNGEPLPTLRQYLLAGLTNNSSTQLIVEIKPSGMGTERGKKIAEKAVALVHQLGAAFRVVYISFDYDILKRILELDATAQTQYLNGDKSPEEVKKDGINGIDYHYSVFQKHTNWIQSAKANKMVLNAWTVNKKEDMQWLLENGFDFITTNEPELLFEMLASEKAKRNK